LNNLRYVVYMMLWLFMLFNMLNHIYPLLCTDDVINSVNFEYIPWGCLDITSCDANDRIRVFTNSSANNLSAFSISRVRHSIRINHINICHLIEIDSFVAFLLKHVPNTFGFIMVYFTT